MKLWKRIVALCLVAGLGMALFACKQSGGQNTPGATIPTNGTEAQTYTVQVTTDNGAALEGVGIYIYEDATLEELVWFAETDEAGQIRFDAPAAEGYVAVLKDVPQGYGALEHYPLTGSRTELVLEAQLLTGELEGLSLKLGDVMYDLTVTDINGNTHQISKLLEQKKAVMLNFWFLGCTPCRMEFPYLQQAYENYSADIEVLALNPVDPSLEAIADYAKEMGLTMPVAACDKVLEKVMNITGYPTTVVIDQGGIISLVHTGTITSAHTFEDIFAHFSAEDYTPGVVNSVEDIATEDPDGEDEIVINNPTEVSGVKSFKLTVRPGETVYCDMYRQFDIYMTINNKYAKLTMNGKTYTPKGGKIAVTVNTPDTYTPVAIGLTNTGDEIQTFTIKLNAKSGSLDNPKKLKLGEFSVSIPAGREEGIYYSYTAGGDGNLVLQCLSATKGIPYDYTLYNLNSYANRNLSADAELDDEGNTVVKVRVRKGQRIQFSCSALPNDKGQYPAIKMTFLAKLDTGKEEAPEQIQKIPYAVTVTNESGIAVPNVYVTFGTDHGGQTEKTNAEGNAIVQLEPGDYSATIRVPSGYTARTTTVALTQARPYVSLKLDTVQVSMKTYTITVTNSSTGEAISGVTVGVDGNFADTDAMGQAAFDLEEGTYAAQIVVPEGYELAAPLAAFDESGMVTIQLKPVTTQTPVSKMEYSVILKDDAGNFFSGAKVTFYKDGVLVAVATTDEKGKATATLEKGEYTVQLPGDFQCDTSNVTLTEDGAAVTLNAVRLSTETEELYQGQYTAHKLVLGSQYIEGLQADVVNYLTFTPTKSGYYSITTTTEGAQLKNCGTGVFIYNTPIACEDNIYTVEIREDMLGQTLVAGVIGTKDATIVVKRTGDIILTSEEMAEKVEYKPNVKPATDYTIPSGKATYIDITGSTVTIEEKNGYYYLNGKQLFLNLGDKNYQYLNLYSAMGMDGLGTPIFFRLYQDGEKWFKEDYVTCMKAYCTAAESTNGLYPLNEDLVYMLKEGGQQKGWWDSENISNYLFGTTKNLNTDIAWMFNICYFS